MVSARRIHVPSVGDQRPAAAAAAAAPSAVSAVASSAAAAASSTARARPAAPRYSRPRPAPGGRQLQRGHRPGTRAIVAPGHTRCQSEDARARMSAGAAPRPVGDDPGSDNSTPLAAPRSRGAAARARHIDSRPAPSVAGGYEAGATAKRRFLIPAGQVLPCRRDFLALDTLSLFLLPNLTLSTPHNHRMTHSRLGLLRRPAPQFSKSVSPCSFLPRLLFP
jgi:hypothetical protein